MSTISVDYDVLNQRGSPAWFTDTFANIPTAGYVGRMFISKDTFAFYRDTGTGWDLIGGPGIGTLTGSGVVGQVSFFNGTQVLAGNNNLFWDNTNSRLGINTTTPGQPLDIHSTGNTLVQLNNTTTANSNISFQNQNVAKWRVGNVYNAGANSFDIQNAGLSTNAISINSTTNNVNFGSTIGNGTFTYTLPSATGTLSLTSDLTGYVTLATAQTITGVKQFTSANKTEFTAGISISNTASGGAASGNTTIGANVNGLQVNFPTGGYNNLNFASTTIGNTYTYPNATGTIALTSDLTGYVTGTGVAGQVAYWSGTSTEAGSNNLFWNNTNARLGIGTTTPTSQLEIYGNDGNVFTDGLRITRNGTPSQYGVFNISGGNNNFIAINTTTGEPSFGWSTSINGTSTTTRMTLNGASYMLDVAGTGNFTGLLTGTSATFSALITSNVTTGINATFNSTNATGSVINFKRSSTNYGYLGNSAELGAGVLNALELRADNDLFLTTTSGYLRVTSGGNVIIGTTADFGYKFFVATPDLTVKTLIGLRNETNNTGGQFISFQNWQNSQIGYISQLTSTTVLYSTSSDYRLKENILPIQNAIDRILKIKPVTYNWKNTNNEVGEGFIAHELQEIVPLAVAGKKDEINKDGTMKIQAIDYGKLTPLLVKAIQELNDKLVRNNIN